MTQIRARAAECLACEDTRQIRQLEIKNIHRRMTAPEPTTMATLTCQTLIALGIAIWLWNEVLWPSNNGWR